MGGDSKGYENMISIGAKTVGKEKLPDSGNVFNVSLTDPRLEKLGIDPATLMGGHGLTEDEVQNRMYILEMREENDRKRVEKEREERKKKDAEEEKKRIEEENKKKEAEEKEKEEEKKKAPVTFEVKGKK
jgi:hypothetical protein